MPVDLMPDAEISPTITHVFFDIDNCLVVSKDEVDLLFNIPANLTLVNRLMNHSQTFAINFQAMKVIFAALQAKGIEIAFITASSRPERDTKVYFEELYELPAGSLLNAIFINSYHNPECGYNKALKILTKQREGKIASNARILAVDDLPFLLEQYEKCHIQTIQACGFPAPAKFVRLRKPGQSLPNNDYLQEIIDACDLQVNLPPISSQESLNAVALSQPAPIVSLYQSEVQQSFADGNVKNIVRFVKFFPTEKLNTYRIEQLESLLFILSKFQSNERVCKLASQVVLALAARDDWNNFALEIDFVSLWPSLSKECFIAALDGFKIPVKQILKIFATCQSPAQSVVVNAAIARYFEKKIFEEIYANGSWWILSLFPNQTAPKDFGELWNFMAQYFVFDATHEHKIFLKSDSNSWPLSREIYIKILEATAKVYESQECNAIQQAAKCLNAGFILQLLRCKYDNGITDRRFIDQCRIALYTLVNNPAYSSRKKGAAIAVLLEYLNRFWLAEDETRLCKSLNHYINKRKSEEPNLAYYINNPKADEDESSTSMTCRLLPLRVLHSLKLQ